MTGIYRIHEKAIHKAEVIKRSLERDGISYTVQMNGQYTVIRACGQAKPKKRSVSRSKPALLTLAQCEKQRKEAENTVKMSRDVLRERLHSQWQGEFHWRQSYPSREVQQRIGHAVAAVISRFRAANCHGVKTDWREPYKLTKQDYAELDAAVGRKVRRGSQLPKPYTEVLEYVVRSEARGDWTRCQREREEKLEPLFREERKSAIQLYQEDKLNLEYWQEMCRLATEREGKETGRAGQICGD